MVADFGLPTHTPALLVQFPLLDIDTLLRRNLALTEA